MLWKDRTDEEIHMSLEKLADKIVSKDMEAPALLFFESIKPVASVGSRLGGAMLAGFIPIIGYSIDDYIVPFRDKENVDIIVKLIEEKIKEKKQKKEEEKQRKKLIKVKKKKPWYWPF